MRNIYSLLFVGLTLTSCMSSFRISVVEPADVRIPQDIQRVGIVNVVNNRNSPEQTAADIVLGGQQINGNIVAAERAVDGIINSFNNSRNLHGEKIPQDDLKELSDAAAWDSIMARAQRRGLHAVLVMTELRSVSPLGGTIVGNVTGQTNSKLEGILHYELRTMDDGGRIEGLSCRSVYNIPISGSTNVIDILSDVAKKREAYRAMGYNLGYRAGARLYPNWVWVGRDYYNKGSKALKAAKPMIRSGNWDIAEKQLNQDIDNGKLKIRGRVLYNMALVKEGQGDLDAAIAFAEQAALECYNKEANEYLVKLRKRKRQLESI